MMYESPNFRLELDDDVLTLWLEFRGRHANNLTIPILNELSLVADRIASLGPIAAVLVRTRNCRSFLEELDIQEMCRLQSPLEFASLARRAQDVTRKLRELPSPTIAIVEGRCAGVGLELALACSARVGIDSPQTRIEFTDLARGLVPFCGGSYRLPRLVGLRTALRLWKNGGSLSATEALRNRVIDRVMRPDRMAIEVMTLLDELRENPHKRIGQARLTTRLADTVFGSSVLRRSRTQTRNPRVFSELVNCLVAGRLSEGEGLIAERAALTRLADEPATRRCLEAARHAAMPSRVFPVTPQSHLPFPQRIGVVGGGQHGLEIARHLAKRGHEVVIQAHAAQLAKRDFPDCVRATTEWLGFDRADFVIEAVSEDLGEKRNVFHELEKHVRPRAILATASSTLLVESLQAELGRPQRIAGMHLPNLGERTPVAEIVGTHLTHSECISALVEWSREWGFTPFVVADRPGRLVGVVRHAYMAEAVALVSEGQPIHRIDAECRKFGMTLGPLEWCDEIGFDRLAEQTAHLQMARDDGFARNLLFQRLLPYGCVGKAVGEGFYRYGLLRRPNEIVRMLLWQDFDEDARSCYVFDPEVAIREGLERIILRTVNEAAAAVADEPDANPASVDLALAYGMGWPLHRGGPLRYADELGLGRVMERLAEFAERFGSRFSPCDELVRRAEAGESFYPCETLSGGKVLAWRVAI